MPLGATEEQGFQIDPQYLHKYLYAHANPVMYWDPSGEMSLMEMSITVSNVGAMTTAAVISLLVVYAIQQVDVISIADSVGAAISAAARKLRLKCSAIIGASAERVVYAKLSRYHLAEVFLLGDVWFEDEYLMKVNREWLQSVKNRKCVIIDIGEDPTRDYVAHPPKFYWMEKDETASYPYMIYDRTIPGFRSKKWGPK